MLNPGLLLQVAQDRPQQLLLFLPPLSKEEALGAILSKELKAGLTSVCRQKSSEVGQGRPTGTYSPFYLELVLFL